MNMSTMAISGLSAHRMLQLSMANMQGSMGKIASGYRINSAADDAAGLAISEKMRAQQTAYERAIMNAQDGSSMVQVADGALSSVNSMLNRLTDLSVQAANGTLNDSQRSIINKEAQSLLSEIDRVSKATNFNGINLLDGSLNTADQVKVQGVQSSKIADSVYVDQSHMLVTDGTDVDRASFSVNDQRFVLVNQADYAAVSAQLQDSGITAISVEGTSGGTLTAGDLNNIASTVNSEAGTTFEAVNAGLAMEVSGGANFQVGITGESYDKVTVGVANMSAMGLGLKGLDLSTQNGASSALSSIKTAMERLATARGGLGATQNRLESTINNLTTTHENITAAESNLRDADIVKAYMDYTKNNILSQTAMSMMAHSKMGQYQALQLFR